MTFVLRMLYVKRVPAKPANKATLFRRKQNWPRLR
jgi:hypothetical protein